MLWTCYPRQWAQLVKLLQLNDYDDEVDDLPDALVTCEICSKRFISTRALAVHRSRAHGKQRLAPRLVDGSTCPACLTDFRTRLRLIHHLEYSSAKCLEVVTSEVHPLMRLNGAEPRKPVSVFSLLVSLAFQRLRAFLAQCCTFESFDSVELFSGFFRVPRGFTCHRHSSL